MPKSAAKRRQPRRLPPLTSPMKHRGYSPDEWEVFITEWATGVTVSYRQIKQLGGSGDRGVDVAAFKTDRGLEDAWDCFQAKHYDGSLTVRSEERRVGKGG